MINYVCLRTSQFEHPPYRLVPLRYEDIYKIMHWRNAQMDVLRQSVLLTEETQAHYYQHVVEPTFTENHPKQILFSLLHNNHCIGYGGLVHIDWTARRGEVSFLVDPKRIDHPKQYREDFSNFLSLIKQVAFNDLNFHKIFTETFDVRPLHIAVLEDNKFVQEGRLKKHVLVDDQFVDSIIHGYIQHD